MILKVDGYNYHLIQMGDLYEHIPSHKCPCGVEWKPRLESDVGVVWNFWHRQMYTEQIGEEV